MRYLVPVVMVVLTCGLASCRDNPPAIYPTVAPYEEAKLPLGPGDKIQLTIYYGSKNIQAQYTIDSSGDIDVQYIGSVKAGGKTANEIRKDIKDRLEDGYLLDPIVSISIVEINSLK